MRKITRIIPILTFIFLMVVDASGQKSALILVDIQQFYFPGGDLPLNNPEEAALNAGLLLARFRYSNDLVIHVRHNYEPGGKIHKYVEPQEGEKVISKDYPNSFRGTNLEKVLRDNSISTVVICGMQTHMCVEATVRAASDKGFNCILVEDACATRALQYETTIITAEHVHQSTLATLKSYGRIVSTGEYLIEAASKD